MMQPRLSFTDRKRPPRDLHSEAAPRTSGQSIKSSYSRTLPASRGEPDTRKGGASIYSMPLPTLLAFCLLATPLGGFIPVETDYD